MHSKVKVSSPALQKIKQKLKHITFVNQIYSLLSSFLTKFCSRYFVILTRCLALVTRIFLERFHQHVLRIIKDAELRFKVELKAIIQFISSYYSLE